ncbi:unnamed protein product [Prorocentrum cordatum]|uniref:Uncharacterized protein n=1 Tax=Prorocentrum cordatum TaxID=2364126 RepID=A0ABN9VM48_9DINO|nr:unnamed protein product [Polarella glacialis]
MVLRLVVPCLFFKVRVGPIAVRGRVCTVLVRTLSLGVMTLPWLHYLPVVLLASMKGLLRWSLAASAASLTGCSVKLDPKTLCALIVGTFPLLAQLPMEPFCVGMLVLMRPPLLVAMVCCFLVFVLLAVPMPLSILAWAMVVAVSLGILAFLNATTAQLKTLTSLLETVFRIGILLLIRLSIVLLFLLFQMPSARSRAALPSRARSSYSRDKFSRLFRLQNYFGSSGIHLDDATACLRGSARQAT